jgi:aspartyl-tRNA(Asn)/glutamyl-tRNA(Gln) amidotransferase subunit C
MDTQEMDKLARLARLALDEKEKQQLGENLQEMLGYMEDIRSLDLQGVEPMTGFDAQETLLRADKVHQSLSSEKAFQNAPKVEQNHFAIPKVMGGN